MKRPSNYEEDGTLQQKRLRGEGVPEEIPCAEVLESSNTAAPGSSYENTNIYGNAHVIQGNVYNYHPPIGNVSSTKDTGDTKENTFRKLFDSLAFERMDARLNNVELALAKTCQWIFDHPRYHVWTDHDRMFDHHGLLWIKGKPGSGKSTIMKALLVKSKELDRRALFVSYFFSARSSSELEKSSLGLYRSLVYQILCDSPEINDAFLEAFRFKVVRGVVSEWTETELKNFLLQALHRLHHSHISIHIDALDEGQEHDIRQLVNYLERLSCQAFEQHVNLRICLSSRHYPHITIRKGLELILDEQSDHKQDIRTYILEMLYIELHFLEPELCRKSAGVFLWVVLVIMMLNTTHDQGANLDTIKDLLDDLPVQLDALFSDILIRNRTNIDASVALLQWVLFSARPLTPQELYLAVQSTSRSPLKQQSLVADDARIRRYLLTYSRGLVEIVADVWGGVGTVQFIHETVREFLLGPNGLCQMDPSLSLPITGPSHETLKEACADILGRDMSPKAYAGEYLFWHAERAQMHNISQKRFLDGLSMERKDVLGAWCFSKSRFNPDDPLLYIVASLGYEHLVECLVTAGVLVNQMGSNGESAFYAACSKGHGKVARLLFAHGARADEVNRNLFQNLFAEACACYRFSIVEILIACGIDVNAKMIGQATPLQIASYYCCTDMIRLLLRAGARVDAHDGPYGTALQEASSRGHEMAVDLLLKAGANVDGCDTEFASPLQIATFYGSFHVVEVLVKAGADVNLQRNLDGCHRMQISSANGVLFVKESPQFVRPVGSEEEFYGTALLMACYKRNVKFMVLLVRAGANVNIYSPTFCTPLQMSCLQEFLSYEDKVRAVRLLLRAGAQINHRCERWPSALQIACARPDNVDIIVMLLEAGADLSTLSENDFVRVFRAACSTGTPALISKLLEHSEQHLHEDYKVMVRSIHTKLHCDPEHFERFLELKYPWINHKEDVLDLLASWRMDGKKPSRLHRQLERAALDPIVLSKQTEGGK